jgi:AraC family transcriptional regulator
MVRTLEFIQKNLDGSLSLERLARVAHLSKFHFHRQFSAGIGVGASKVVRLLRLKRASFRLVFDRRPSVTANAFDAGFANAESFSRAFRSAFGQSPRQFRDAPRWQSWRARYRFLERIGHPMNPVEIVHFAETKVAALEHRGAPDDVYNTTRRFIEWRRENGVTPATSRTFGIHYNDYNSVRSEDYRIDICASVEADVKPNPQGVVTKLIPGGRCARIRHLGSREHMDSVVYLVRDWLPASGENARDCPMFYHYVNVEPDVKEHEMITDVYLPLE